MSPEALCRYPIRSGFLALPSTVDSHLMHTSLHFQNFVLSLPCIPTHPSQPHTRLLQEHGLFSRQLSPRSRQLDPRGISVKNISWLQRLQSTLARVVTSQRVHISISKTLQELHWLPIKWRIDYKVGTLIYKLLESGEPTYLRSRITSKIF